MSDKIRGRCLQRSYPGQPRLHTLTRTRPGRYPFLLENTGSASQLGRYDILFAYPGDTLVCNADGSTSRNGQPTGQNNFLQQLNAIAAGELTDDNCDAGLPFCGGWFLYLGYELAAEIEPVLADSMPPSLLPRATMTRIPAGIICDRVKNECTLFATGRDAEQMLASMQNDLDNIDSAEALYLPDTGTTLQEEDEQRFTHGIERIKQYIAAGDVFQVNLSRQWQSAGISELTALDAYARLRETNPAPFSCYARLDDGTFILSSSPERLVEARAGRVSTRPIAGTYPRGGDHDEDRRLSSELLMHPKERAEHIMLVDLERNDLGRICRPGSVKVPELMVVESYEHVHHIVSEVTGELCTDVLPGDIISAVFPGGTITGCPKIRCMEIIAELEQGPRDAYTGSVGYLGTNGDLDLNILIRTITMHQGRYTLRAGAGIVADSDPARELAETRAKAEGMCRVFSNA